MYKRQNLASSQAFQKLYTAIFRDSLTYQVMEDLFWGRFNGIVPALSLIHIFNSDGQLTLGEVKQTSQQEMTLALQGKAQPVTQEVVVHYSANVSIKAAHWAAPNNTVSYTHLFENS